MEILIVCGAALLIVALLFVHNHAMIRQRASEEAVRKELDTTRETLETCLADFSRTSKDVQELKFESNVINDQYNEMLMLVLPRLFHMELTAYIHHHGVVRQTLTFNDEKLKLAIATMLCIVLPKYETIDDLTQYAQEMVKQDYYLDYFKEHVLFGNTPGLLRITGHTPYDALNTILDAVLSHSESGVIGSPKYQLITKQPIARI